MNCKPGCLARIVGPSRGPNRDRIVRCIRLLALGEEMKIEGWTFLPTSHGEFWAVEGRLLAEGMDGSINTVVPGGPIDDKWLRPIHDPGEDAQDETLTWKPVPQGEEQAA